MNFGGGKSENMKVGWRVYEQSVEQLEGEIHQKDAIIQNLQMKINFLEWDSRGDGKNAVPSTTPSTKQD